MLDFRMAKVFTLDTETTGLEWHRHDIFGFSVADSEEQTEGRYFDIRKFPKSVKWLEDQIDAADWVYAHNAKFDMHMLESTGIRFDPRKFRCTMVRAALINEHEREYNLDYLMKKYVGLEKIEMSKEEKAAMQHLPLTRVSPYAIRDAMGAHKLAVWQEAQLDLQDLRRVDELETRILQINTRSERRGIRVDMDAAQAAIPALDDRLDDLMKQIQDMAGFAININSAPQIRTAFGAEKGDDNIWRTKDGFQLEETDGGAPSFNKDALKRMGDPLATAIIAAREVGRLGGTFLKQHVLGHARVAADGTWRVHPNINQTRGENDFGTVTGRMSYNEPAMQQIPSRNEGAAAIMRPIFLPERGHEWCYGDLDQHEFRVFAHYTRNKMLEQMYKDNPDTDFHGLVSGLTGLPRSAKSSGQANAKQVNLGLVFNMGAGLLAKQMGLPYEEREFRKGKDKDGNPIVKKYLAAGPETAEVLQRYHRAIPGVKEMAEQAAGIASTRGYVKTLLGRRIRFPDPQYSYKASGLVYQGTSADANKLNIVTVADVLEGSDSSYIMNVHDEYSLSLAPGDDHRVKEIQSGIQDRGMIRIPIRIDFTAGENWWRAAKHGRKLT